jgi:hypothetical protein
VLPTAAVTYGDDERAVNLDRMLHRGIYNVDATARKSSSVAPHVFSKMLGITKEQRARDKVIAWGFSSTASSTVSWCVSLVVAWNSVAHGPRVVSAISSSFPSRSRLQAAFTVDLLVRHRGFSTCDASSAT